MEKLRRLRLKRQGLLIAFGASLALAVNLPYIILAQHWSLILLLPSWPIIAAFMWFVWHVIEDRDKEIGKMEEAKYQEQLKVLREETRKETRTALTQIINEIINNRDQQLVNAMTQAISQTLETALERQTQAIVAALQENSRTIISAMREPLDGHE